MRPHVNPHSHPHYTDEETEALGGSVPCSRSLSAMWQDPDMVLGWSDFGDIRVVLPSIPSNSMLSLLLAIALFKEDSPPCFCLFKSKF